MGKRQVYTSNSATIADEYYLKSANGSTYRDIDPVAVDALIATVQGLMKFIVRSIDVKHL